MKKISSAIAEGPSDALFQLTLGQLHYEQLSYRRQVTRRR